LADTVPATDASIATWCDNCTGDTPCDIETTGQHSGTCYAKIDGACQPKIEDCSAITSTIDGLDSSGTVNVAAAGIAFIVAGMYGMAL
jgi:hypothetical protein